MKRTAKDVLEKFMIIPYAEPGDDINKLSGGGNKRLTQALQTDVMEMLKDVPINQNLTLVNPQEAQNRLRKDLRAKLSVYFGDNND
jgi:hypothetical protein